MPRRQNNETHIRCSTFKNYTQSIEPVVFKRDLGNRFHFKAVCVICNKFKTKYLNLEQVKALPDEIMDSDDGSIFTILLYVIMKFFLLYLWLDQSLWEFQFYHLEIYQPLI